MAKQKKDTSKKQSPQGRSAHAQDSVDHQGYAVLARKYRPSTFDDLIGQEAMVRTLSNAFASGRIAQAYMLTGVRGVGKTTTARILARALNYEREGIDGPTIDMDKTGEHCTAIMESRHVDVLEMDAASHTGIDDIREIIESARYKPVSARMKVYIIDEVHMLSKAAFNGLLKTLEEPPDHVKFIFATTEIRKVPVTVLSRCQRFDLRRVDVEQLHAHFSRIAKLENAEVDDEALTLIARASEGSVRDGLSILDQAIAHSGGDSGEAAVTGDHIRAMLGLADRGRIFDLLESVLRGEVKLSLDTLRGLYDDGAEPLRILTDLAEAVHVITRIVAVGPEGADPTLSEGECVRAGELAEKLDMSALARAWQMLLKGAGEAQSAPRPLAAAEMVLVRMSYLSGQPSPEDLAKQITDTPLQNALEPQVPPVAEPAGGNGGNGGEPQARAVSIGAPRASSGAAQALPVEDMPPEARRDRDEPELPSSFPAVVAFVEEHREVLLARALREYVRIVSYAPPSIEINLNQGAQSTLPNELRTFLNKATGTQWVVAISDEPGEPTLNEVSLEMERVEQALRADEVEVLKDHPAVREVMRYFPGAEITDVRPLPTADEETE